MNGTELKPHIREIMPANLEEARASVNSLSAAVAAARAKAGPDAVVLAWLSDLHIHAPQPYAGMWPAYSTDVDTSANLQLALTEIGALLPVSDVLILGGDLADSGFQGQDFAAEYAELKRVLDLHLPPGPRVLPLLGNHDHDDGPLPEAWHATWKANCRPEWPRPVESDDFFYASDWEGWRFVALDTRASQPLSDRQYQWLQEQLADRSLPTVVSIHRPFVPVGNWVDNMSLVDDRTFELLDNCPAVKLVLSGHTHKAAHWDFRNKRHVVFPACAYGLPDNCGWGVVVLSGSEVESVFVKDLSATIYDGIAMQARNSPGDYRELEPQPLEGSPLFNPGVFPPAAMKPLQFDS